MCFADFSRNVTTTPSHTKKISIEQQFQFVMDDDDNEISLKVLPLFQFLKLINNIGSVAVRYRRA